MGREEEAHGHELEPVALERDDPLVGGGLRAAVHARDQGERGAVDVRVEEAHAGTALLHGERQIDGGGALADPALARRHGEHVADAGQDELLLDGRDGLAGVRRHVHPDVVHAVEGEHALARRALELGLDGAGGRRELDVERDAPAVDL